ncbi:hypothetical protein ACLMMA_14515 [Micrococcus luteus]
MFDSMYDAGGHEWQTKAFGNILERWELGDEMPNTGTATYQVEVLGGPGKWDTALDSLATVRDGHLASIGDERDESLPLLDYYGDWAVKEGA